MVAFDFRNPPFVPVDPRFRGSGCREGRQVSEGVMSTLDQ